MESTIPVLVLKECNSGEPPVVYRLDDPGEGDRFFKNLLHNTERNESHSIILEEWPKEKWDECERVSAELA